MNETLLIYNPDGSIRYTHLGHYINQNNHNVDKFFVAVHGKTAGTNFYATAYFTLPNGTQNFIALTTTETITIGSESYVGYSFYLTNAQTYLYGVLKMSIEVKSDSTHTLFTYHTELTINETSSSPDETTITLAEYNSLVDSINAKGGAGITYWGGIRGTLASQTDLNNELTNIREVASGKSKSFVISYNETAPTTDSQAHAIRKPDGTYFADLQEFTTYFSGLSLGNSDFNSDSNAISISNGKYYIVYTSTGNSSYSSKKYAYKYSELPIQIGDDFYVRETTLSPDTTRLCPDRWVGEAATLYVIETVKQQRLYQHHIGINIQNNTHRVWFEALLPNNTQITTKEQLFALNRYFDAFGHYTLLQTEYLVQQIDLSSQDICYVGLYKGGDQQVTDHEELDLDDTPISITDTVTQIF